MDTVIRSAAPPDCERLAYLSYLAGRGHVRTSAYDLMFPGPYGPSSERLGAMAAILNSRSRSWFHFSNYTVAEVDGIAAASLCTFVKREGRNRPLFTALEEAGWTGDDITGMGVAMQPFIVAEPEVPDDAWVIENVGCYEQYRRRGLTNALLESAVAGGLELGRRRMMIGVFIGNLPAIHAYEKAGFAITAEKRAPEFARVFECPGMYQMTFEA
jgi:translation initiation factor 4G